MSINVDWDDELKMVLVITFPKQWEWDEVYRAKEAANQLVQTVDYDVALIQDMHKTTNLPANAFRHMRAILGNTHPHIKHIIFVGMQPLVRRLWSTFTELNLMLTRERNFLFVSDMYEARGLIRQMLDTAKKG